jgi:hypothetical protein
VALELRSASMGEGVTPLYEPPTIPRIYIGGASACRGLES